MSFFVFLTQFSLMRAQRPRNRSISTCAQLCGYLLGVLLLCSNTSPVFAQVSGESFRLNQVGYHPQAIKIAMVLTAEKGNFQVVDAQSKKVVFSGALSEPQQWPVSEAATQQADFSALNTAGRYQLQVADQLSHPFTIGEQVLSSVHDAAIKSYYYIRSGMEIAPEFAGPWARAAGHPDTRVKVHASAASKLRPAGTILESSRGWYDAGDFGKYVVNSGITTYTLLMAWDHFADFYQDRNLNIPESGDAVPDILNEIKWNLDWLITMQDYDGGVYHKLTTLNFVGMEKMPAQEQTQRFMIGKSVTATLNFAAVMAKASRIYAEYEKVFPGLSKQYSRAAIDAYAWAEQNPNAYYEQPKDVRTGPYDDTQAEDEFALAAIELFITTQELKYWTAFTSHDLGDVTALAWPHLTALVYLALFNDASGVIQNEQKEQYQQPFILAADALMSEYRQSAYAVPALAEDFEWGSNSNILNNGIVLMQAYRLTSEPSYLHAALATIDYVLGANATGYSFVTGHGHKTPMHLHNRLTTADDNKEPIPGLVAGGPHNGKQDKCRYPSNMPADTYADIVCSYSTNETAINWNAPLVYMLAAALTTY